MKDRSKISNSERKIRKEASNCGVDPIIIRIVRQITKSNDSNVVYEFIKKNKGKKCTYWI